MGQYVRGHARILLSKINEILQSQDSHPTKICLGIVPLEADLLPLLGHPRVQGLVRHQQAPQFQQLLLVVRIIRAVRHLSELLALHAELTVAPDQFHAFAERLGKVRMCRGIDLLGHQHSSDGILEDLALRFRRYPAVVGDVVQVRDEGPDVRVARLPEGLLDGGSARRTGLLSVADPLQLTHLRGLAQEPFYQGPEIPAHQGPKVPEHVCPIEDCDDCLSKKRPSKNAVSPPRYPVLRRPSSHPDDSFSSRCINSVMQIIPDRGSSNLTGVTSHYFLSLFLPSASPPTNAQAV